MARSACMYRRVGAPPAGQAACGATAAAAVGPAVARKADAPGPGARAGAADPGLRERRTTDMHLGRRRIQLAAAYSPAVLHPNAAVLRNCPRNAGILSESRCRGRVENCFA